MTQWYYERNTALINHPINKTFDEILVMTADEFRQWVIDLRRLVVRLWDEDGQPPRVGYDTNAMIEQFRQMESFLVGSFVQTDELTGEKNVIRCTSNIGNAVNQFFPTMLKTRINYTKDASAGKSIYDYFAKDDLLDTFITYATRHFKRDSFYSHSTTVATMDLKRYGCVPVTQTGVEWITQFETEKWRDRGIWDYWLSYKEEDATYTGYNEELKDTSYLRLTRAEIESLWDLIPAASRTHVDWTKGESYTIRAYEKGQRLFPIGLKAFRVSFCQYAVNFPPLIAKYIYEQYTEQWKHEDTIYVWDPSCGWGGRLLGALSVEDSRHITYLGNDPNTDHTTTPGRTKYHEIHTFYSEHVKKGGMWGLDHTHFQFWQKGSEVMQHEASFQQYKGKISVVFTSPPYFSKEAYSEDDAQSYKKFSDYATWRDGFLKETLATAYEWLRPGGIIVWNIANAKFGNETLPLEDDSCQIMEDLGFQFIRKHKMTLAQMPGGNRMDSVTGLPKFKNYCKVKGAWFKYEPFLVYQKPI
jgi:hypothetical protein